MINEYAFPFGIYIKKIDFKDNLDSINEYNFNYFHQIFIAKKIN